MLFDDFKATGMFYSLQLGTLLPTYNSTIDSYVFILLFVQLCFIQKHKASCLLIVY